jgi:limonene-1,2-epoxide hydrolase
MRPLGAILLAAFAVGLLSSCGGSDDSEPLEGHEAVAVIEGWVQALSDGDVSAAADYFALPSVAQNGPTPLTLRTRSDVTAFNRSLPCGGELVRARPAGRFINATFRLTDRPGGNCGRGTGELARTAFAVENGKIVQWRRLADPSSDGSETGPIV